MAEIKYRKKVKAQKDANEAAQKLIEEVLDDQVEYMDLLDRKRMMSKEEDNKFICDCDCDYRCEI